MERKDYFNYISENDPSYLVTDNLKSIDLFECSKLLANEENAKLVHTTLDNMKEYNSWYLYQDNTYYLKHRPSNIVILNELIGEELSKYMHLPTIEYSVVTSTDEIIGLMSKNFLDGTYEHLQSINASKKMMNDARMMIMAPNFKCDEVVREQITSLIIRNFYASLNDRMKNAHIGIKDGKMIISPLFDYESSFLDADTFLYNDPLFGFSFNEESIKYIKENNKYFNEYLERIYDYSILVSLENIKNKHGINIPDSFITYYTDYERKRKANIKKLGL